MYSHFLYLPNTFPTFLHTEWSVGKLASLKDCAMENRFLEITNYIHKFANLKKSDEADSSQLVTTSCSLETNIAQLKFC